MHLIGHKKCFLRCLGGRCLTITAITIALSAANNPSKIQVLKVPINKVKSNSDPLWTTPFSLNTNKETYANLIAKVSLSNILPTLPEDLSS